MPRIAGQIDHAKGLAILDAAMESFAERGLAAGMEDIARRAGVSKQTIYNHYGSKAELFRALASRAVDEITAALDLPGAVENPLETLTGFGRAMLSRFVNPRSRVLTRLAILSAADMPELGMALYEGGPVVSRKRLADFLRLENAAGRLDAPNPEHAAEVFAGMVSAPYQFASLLGVPRVLAEEDLGAIAREVAERFMRAYAPAEATG